MKTLLSINGETYLLPESKDLAKVIETLKGLQPVNSRTVYGPEGEHRYSEEHGYCVKWVLGRNQAKLKLEMVLDDEVVDQHQFDRLTEAAAPVQRILPAAA